MKRKTAKFPKRIVVGVGFPWALGLKPYKSIEVRDKPIAGWSVPINFPNRLWSKDVPRYRLVLERMAR